MIEYWVVRVLIGREGADREARIAEAQSDAGIARSVASGALAWLSGELCESIECYRYQGVAEMRAAAEHARTGATHKVVLSADVD